MSRKGCRRVCRRGPSPRRPSGLNHRSCESGVHLRIAMRQGTLIQDGCVVAERRLKLSCSLYQRDESLQSLSPSLIIGVDTRRWGRLLVGHIVSPLSLWYSMQGELGRNCAIGTRLGNIGRCMFICMYIRTDELMCVSVPIPRKAPAPGLRGLGRCRGVSG
jgi:hypothetical protein